MHHALEIQEILLGIFAALIYPTRDIYQYRWRSDLARLARTCRVFKEPALDLLWRNLDDASPLARCLPGICLGPYPYSFKKRLTRRELKTLQGYALRVHSIRRFDRGLDWESVKKFLNPRTQLIQVLMNLFTRRPVEKIIPFLSLPFPSLVSFNFTSSFEDEAILEDLLLSLSKFSPNIRRLCLTHRGPGIPLSTFTCICTYQWRNLQTVYCPDFILDVDTVVHLSRIPGLTELAFTVGATLPARLPPLVFSKLDLLKVKSLSVDPISRLVSVSQLPAIRDLDISIDHYPPRKDLTYFLIGLVAANAGRTIEKLRLVQPLPSESSNSALRLQALPLSLEDLWPCMALNSLRDIELDIGYNVDFRDSHLLALGLAWPYLENISLNKEWGWNSHSGITPGGLIGLLETCRFLRGIALAMDTRGYTEVSPSQVPKNLGLMFPPEFFINVVDSTIEEGSMAAVIDFLCGIAECCGSGGDFSLYTWQGDSPDWIEDLSRWMMINSRIEDTFGRLLSPYYFTGNLFVS